MWGTYLLYHGERATKFCLEKRRTLPSSSSISPGRTKNSKYSTPRKKKQKRKTQARFENNKTERLFVFQIIIIIRHRIVWAWLWKIWGYFCSINWQKNKQETISNFSTPTVYPARARSSRISGAAVRIPPKQLKIIFFHCVSGALRSALFAGGGQKGRKMIGVWENEKNKCWNCGNNSIWLWRRRHRYCELCEAVRVRACVFVSTIWNEKIGKEKSLEFGSQRALCQAAIFKGGRVIWNLICGGDGNK